MDRRIYKTPPIIEAVCVIHFAPGNDWDLTFPALFYAKVRHEYDGKPREQRLLNVEPNPKDVPLSTGGSVAVNEITRTQFMTKDEKRVIGVYRDDMAVSVLRPYPGWEVFRPAIKQALDVYDEIVKPKGVRRIGLRYINQVQIEGDMSQLLACFSNPPANLANAECRIENFTSRNEYVYIDEPIKVAVTLARIVAPVGKFAALLDIDLVSDWPAEPLPLDQTMKKVDEFRRRERIVFESLITDRARALFDA